jgi:YEATS family
LPLLFVLLQVGVNIFVHMICLLFDVVIKSPPYEVSESGYGGFEVFIEIYFRNKLEPRKVQFSYDLWLPLDNPEPVVSQRVEKLTFLDPADDFAEKLFKAGGVSRNKSSVCSSYGFKHIFQCWIPMQEHLQFGMYYM